MKKTKLVSLLLALVVVIGLAACGKKADAPTDASQDNDKMTVVKVGVVGEDSAMWPPIIERLKEENIDVQLVKFGEYTIPNAAVNDGEVDLNAFQHYAYLNKEVEEKGYKIVAIGETYISPQNVYSKKIKSIDEVKEGDKIAIPNDHTNGGRALKVLESAGLIKTNPEKGYTPEVRDIIENPLKLEFIEVDAANVYANLPEVALGVINANYALDAGLKPQEDAIFKESFEGNGEGRNPYINVLVAREEDKDNEVYQKVLQAYQSEETVQLFKEEYKDSYLAGWKY